MQNKSIFLMMAFAAFAVAAFAGYFGPPAFDHWKARKETAAFIPPAVPKRQFDAFARDFANVHAAIEPRYFADESLVDSQERPVRIEDFSSMPVLVNLWASWCAPCVVELPSLEKMRARYDGRIKVLAVAVENGKTTADVAAFLDGRGLAGLGVYLDEGAALLGRMELRGIPTSFLIGRNGQILYRFEGDADWDSPESREFFDVFLLQNR